MCVIEVWQFSTKYLKQRELGRLGSLIDVSVLTHGFNQEESIKGTFKLVIGNLKKLSLYSWTVWGLCLFQLTVPRLDVVCFTAHTLGTSTCHPGSNYQE